MPKSTTILLLNAIILLSPITAAAKAPAERSLLKVTEEKSQGSLPQIQFTYREIPEYEGHSCSFRAEIPSGNYSARFEKEKWNGLECDGKGTIEDWQQQATATYESTVKTVRMYSNYNHPYQCELTQRVEVTLRLEGLELAKETSTREFVENSLCPWIR